MKKHAILVVVILALVVFASGCINLGNLNSNQSAQNNSTASNVTVNTTPANTSTATSTKTTTQSNKVNLISAQRAIDIVEQSAGYDPNLRYTARLIKNNGAPYYIVDVYDDNPDSETYGQGIGGAKVDARTGVILDEMG